MVMIAKAFNSLRKTLKQKVFRRRRKGSTQTFEPQNPITEAEVETEGGSNASAVEEEEATTPRENGASSLSLNSPSESSELAGVRPTSSYDNLSPATAPIDHGVSNPNLIRVENSSSALSSASAYSKETPNPWTPPVFDDVITTQTLKNAIGEAYFRRKICFKFHHPLFDGKPYLGEPLKLKDDLSSVQDRLTTLEDFDQRVSRQKVLLEFCMHGHNDLLSRYIQVANITYHKNVFLRFSYDGWSSYNDVKASHCFSYTEYNTDRFSFEIPLRQSFSTLEFVVGYETDGCGTYWDNNDGNCYTIVMEKEAAPKSSVRESLNKLLLHSDTIAIKVQLKRVTQRVMTSHCSTTKDLE